MTTYHECECQNCHIKFKRMLSEFKRQKRRGCNSFCSQKCLAESRKKSVKLNCMQCNDTIEKTPSQIKKTKYGRVFCSQSCAATYNNAHKTTGTRRSKLEKYLEQQLTQLYSNLEIKFNSKEEINSELDIYIPLLKLAFELNGIFHYEPIYGQDKLDNIQNNDDRKFQACIEQGIELCIIDTSQQKRFTEKSSKKYLDIIINIISNKLNKN